MVANARLFGFLDLILQLPHLGVLPMGEYGNIQLVQPTIQWYIFIATHMIGYQSHLHIVYIPWYTTVWLWLLYISCILYIYNIMICLISVRTCSNYVDAKRRQQTCWIARGKSFLEWNMKTSKNILLMGQPRRSQARDEEISTTTAAKSTPAGQESQCILSIEVFDGVWLCKPVDVKHCSPIVALKRVLQGGSSIFSY